MNKKINKIVKFLEGHTGYIRWGPKRLAVFFGCSIKTIIEIRNKIKNKSWYKEKKGSTHIVIDKSFKENNISKHNSDNGHSRIFFDIETAPNIGFFWQSGYKLNIGPENIIKERAIICICYKFENEDIVHSLTWDKGNDYQMVKKFAKIVDGVDELVGHNSRSFDVKWLKTRCLFHNIQINPNIVSLDTLTISRKEFRFNSNKLNYIAGYLGVGGKTKTDFDLWKTIVLDNNIKSLRIMVDYCKNDVLILEKVFNKLKSYTQHKTHRALIVGGEKYHCPECISINTHLNKTSVTKMGIIRRQMECNDCGQTFVISNKTYMDSLKLDMKK